jgi:hypothetical protein
MRRFRFGQEKQNLLEVIQRDSSKVSLGAIDAEPLAGSGFEMEEFEFSTNDETDPRTHRADKTWPILLMQNRSRSRLPGEVLIEANQCPCSPFDQGLLPKRYGFGRARQIRQGLVDCLRASSEA